MKSYEAGKFSEAATQLERLLPQAPRSFELHELLGLVYGAEAENGKAVEQLRLAVQLNASSVLARTNLATGLLKVGKPEEAEIQLRGALEIDPHDYSVNHNLAELYLRQNRMADAIRLLQAAQQIRPAAYDNGYDLALANLLAGNLKDSKELIETLLAQKDTGELHNLLGRVDEAGGEYLEAANQFSLAAHLNPSEDSLFVWASELLLHRTYGPAIEVFREATKRFPGSQRLWIGLGMSLYSRGEYDEAIRVLVTAADLNPKDSRCYLFLSKAYLSSPSQAESVIERFRRYAELEPGSALAQYYYGVSLWKGRRVDRPDVDYKAVEALLQRSIALDGHLAEVHLQLGILYTDQHAYEEAFPEYERALQLDPKLADAHFRLGRYYVHAGEKIKAQSEFDTFKSLQAQHQAAVDKERAEVRQFVVATQAAPSSQ